MAFSFVQEKLTADSATATTTISVTLSPAGVTNDLIHGSVSYNTGDTLNSVKDNNGVSATIVDTVADNTNGQILSTFYFKGISGAPTTLTANLTASTVGHRMGIQEWSGADTSAPLDAHVIALSSVNPETSGNVTTNFIDLVGGYITSGVGVTVPFGAGTGFTLRNDGQNAANSVSYQDESLVQSAAGNVAATFSQASAFACIVGVMAFKPPAAAAPTGIQIFEIETVF